MASAAQLGHDNSSHTGILGRLGWLGFTVLIGVLLSLVGGWAAEMRATDKRNEQDIRALELRLGKLESGIERVETKLDLLRDEVRRRK